MVMEFERKHRPRLVFMKSKQWSICLKCAKCCYVPSFFCNIRMRFVILSINEYDDDDEDSGIGTTTLLVFTKAKKWNLGYTVP